MSVFEKDYIVTMSEMGISNTITNGGILRLFEDIACAHSDIVGLGINQIEQTHLSWFLLQWKVHVFKRAVYNEAISIKTWSRNASKCLTYRDFEMYDQNGNLICIASSKWALIDTTNGKILKITKDVIDRYCPENEKNVFDEIDIPKLQVPKILESDVPNYVFNVLRRDIDINQHMHNLYYLDYALEALPQDIYEVLSNCNNFEIMYKSGIQLGDTVNCFCIKQDNQYIVVMKNAKEPDKLHCVVKFSL